MAKCVKIPSEEEVRQLPRLAQLAFMAHSSRLAMPYYELKNPESPDIHLKSIRALTNLAENFALGKHYDTSNHSFIEVYQFAEETLEALTKRF